MRSRDRARRSALAGLSAAILLAPLVVGTPATAQTAVSFDFEDGVTGWLAPDWLDANAGAVSQSTEQAVSGAHSLALPVNYQAGVGWTQSGATFRFDQQFSASGTATFRVYAPVAGLSARFQFNDPWTEPSGLRALSPGWNEIVYTIAADFPQPVTRVHEILLFVVAQNLPETFQGNVFFDDVAFTSGEPSDPPPPSEDIAFDFEDGVTGWFAPDWLASNDLDEPITQDDTQAASGQFSLALPVTFLAGGGFEQAGAVYRFPNAPVNLLRHQSVTFHVFAPVSGLSADLVFNDPWNPPTGMRPLSPGWNELTFDISAASTDWPGGVPSANEFIIRVVAQNLPATYDGPIWIDAIEFVEGTAPVLSLVTPRPDGILSVPDGSSYRIEAQAAAAGDRQLASVTWRSGSQQGTLAPDPDTGNWVGDWDIWAEGEGVVELAVTATDDAGESITARAVVLVRNSALSVDITSPSFDEQIDGTVQVTATVTPDDRFDLAEVVLYGLENEFGEACEPNRNHCRPIRMDLTESGDGTVTATARLNTRRLADGIESLAVEARDGRFAVRDLTHVVVRNRSQRWDFVDTRRTNFVHRGQPFRYLGFNEYELFTTPENFGRDMERDLDETVFGEVLLPGTPRTWEDNVDRELLEAARNGYTVLRTWAFNRNDETSAYQRMVNGEIVFQESTFQRLDYIMDSARRHGIRVILTLDNYWPDYGGIGRAAQWLGLENKLQFFTDPAAIALYQEYAEHLVTRVNTVNGRPYSQDPTVFSWELMNEPRSWCVDDPTPDDRFCDPTGATMRAWIGEQAAFIRDLAPHQLVSAGGEAHGWVPTPGGGIQWGGPDEGNNNIPYYDMDLPQVDFFTFHPYPNADWAAFDKTQTRELVTSLARMGVERGKPVVMEEWGIIRTEPVYDDAGALIEPTDPGYEAERRDHYRMMAEACYAHGCAGTNVWMLADWSDRALNVNLYRPGPDAARDAELVAELRHWGELAADGDLPAAPAPSCTVDYHASGSLSGVFFGTVRITNTGNRTIEGWQLGWWFEGGQQVEAAVGASVSQDGALVTATNAAWNARIRPGKSQTIGFIGSTGEGGNPEPAVFTLGGEICRAN
jgi:cellulose binding protein with CBM2 domain/cellulase (glycosyl hydrolase family 5)